MPNCFKKYKNLQVIIDATEFFVKSPTHKNSLNIKLRREESFVRKDQGKTRASQFYPEAITSGTKSMTTLKTKMKSVLNADQSKT